MLRKTKQTILIVSFIALAHFAASFYVSFMIGTIAGTVVGETLIIARDANEVSDNVTDQMAQRVKESSGSWVTLSYILAFPVVLLTSSLSDNVMQRLVHAAVVSKTLSPEQMKTRLWAFGVFRMLLNSVVSAICIFGVWSLIKKSVLRTEQANTADR